MPHREIHASGSLDNSGCKRLRISSLVDMPEEQAIEDNLLKYELLASGNDLVDALSSKGLDTDMWKTMLTSAFKESVPARR